MSTEAIEESEFLREYTRELHNKNAAVFAGAGLSTAVGYVDWKGLMKDVIRDLRLNPDKEHDLVTLAQYYCNQAGGNRTRLSQTIFNHFAWHCAVREIAHRTPTLHLLAKLRRAPPHLFRLEFTPTCQGKKFRIGHTNLTQRLSRPSQSNPFRRNIASGRLCAVRN